MVANVGQVDEKSSWEADVSRQSCPLGADRVFDDLDKDFLALAKEVGDIRVRHVGLKSLALLCKKNVCEIIENTARFADVKKRVAGKPDINERCLHSWKDPVDPTLVQVADHRRRAMPFRSIRDQARIFKHRDPGFKGVHGEIENRTAH